MKNFLFVKINYCCCGRQVRFWRMEASNFKDRNCEYCQKVRHFFLNICEQFHLVRKPEVNWTAPPTAAYVTFVHCEQWVVWKCETDHNNSRRWWTNQINIVLAGLDVVSCCLDGRSACDVYGPKPTYLGLVESFKSSMGVRTSWNRDQSS